MSPLSVLLVAAALALLHCGLATTPVTGVGTMYQHWAVLWLWSQTVYIAYRIGQVECLKSLLSEGNTQYGLGALHRGNYTTDITRFSLRQQIAFLMGQLQCLKIHLNLEGNRTNTNTVPGEHNTPVIMLPITAPLLLGGAWQDRISVLYRGGLPWVSYSHPQLKSLPESNQLLPSLILQVQHTN